MPIYYDPKEIVISERFVVQLVIDDTNRIIATRVFDTYCDDIIEDCQTTRVCIRRALQEVQS